MLHYSHDFIERSFAMANEFVLTPAAWLQPASLFTPTPKAAQRVLEFSARRSITITRARLISTPRAAFRTDHRSVLERGGHQFGGKARKERVIGIVHAGWRLRLFRIIDSSDPERKLDGAGNCFGLWWVVSTWVCDLSAAFADRAEPAFSDLVSSSSLCHCSFALVSRRRRLSLAACS